MYVLEGCDPSPVFPFYRLLWGAGNEATKKIREECARELRRIGF
jgi:hypothetical protein